MSYDFDNLSDHSPPKVTTFVPDPKDLETIVTLLELAAIDLTSKPGDTFTLEELLSRAMEYGGSEMGVDEADIKIVLPFVKFLGKREKRHWLK